MISPSAKVHRSHAAIAALEMGGPRDSAAFGAHRSTMPTRWKPACDGGAAAASSAAFMESRARIVRFAIVLAAFAGRLFIALRPVDFVDRLFVADDAYYTLSIARAMARGLGPAADGVHPTNGFQPLLAFLEVPIAARWVDPVACLRASLILLAAVDAGVAWALGTIAGRAAGTSARLASVVATIAWAVSPWAIGYALGGLETSLALASMALLVLAWGRARARAGLDGFVVAGAAAGVALLARIDLAILVAALAVWESWRGRHAGVLVAAAVAALVVAPWWGYELGRFHTVVPSSGAAVHELLEVHRSLYLTLPKQLAWALGTVIEAPLAGAWGLRDALWHLSGLGAALAPLAIGALSIAAWRAVAAGPYASPIRIGLLFGPALFVFYGLYLPALWFLPRYLAPVHATVTVLGAVLLARLEAAARPARKALTAGGGLALGVGSGAGNSAPLRRNAVVDGGHQTLRRQGLPAAGPRGPR